MSQWKNTKNSNAAPVFAGGLINSTSTANVAIDLYNQNRLIPVDSNNIQNSRSAHTGWTLITQGTGGRSGRVTIECLVAGYIVPDGVISGNSAEWITTSKHRYSPPILISPLEPGNTAGIGMLSESNNIVSFDTKQDVYIDGRYHFVYTTGQQLGSTYKMSGGRRTVSRNIVTGGYRWDFQGASSDIYFEGIYGGMAATYDTDFTYMGGSSNTALPQPVGTAQGLWGDRVRGTDRDHYANTGVAGAENNVVPVLIKQTSNTQAKMAMATDFPGWTKAGFAVTASANSTVLTVTANPSSTPLYKGMCLYGVPGQGSTPFYIDGYANNGGSNTPAGNTTGYYSLNRVLSFSSNTITLAPYQIIAGGIKIANVVADLNNGFNGSYDFVSFVDGAASFTGSIANTTLTVTVGTPVVGSIISGTGVANGTVITASTNATSYTVDTSQTVASTAMTGYKTLTGAFDTWVNTKPGVGVVSDTNTGFVWGINGIPGEHADGLQVDKDKGFAGLRRHNNTFTGNYQPGGIARNSGTATFDIAISNEDWQTDTSFALVQESSTYTGWFGTTSFQAANTDFNGVYAKVRPNQSLSGHFFPDDNTATTAVVDGTTRSAIIFTPARPRYTGMIIEGLAPSGVRYGKQMWNPSQTASFTGSISGNTLTVSAVANGALSVGQVVDGPLNIGFRPSMIVASTNSTSYTLNKSQTVGSVAMTATRAVPTDYVSPGYSGERAPALVDLKAVVIEDTNAVRQSNNITLSNSLDAGQAIGWVDLDHQLPPGFHIMDASIATPGSISSRCFTLYGRYITRGPAMLPLTATNYPAALRLTLANRANNSITITKDFDVNITAGSFDTYSGAFAVNYEGHKSGTSKFTGAIAGTTLTASGTIYGTITPGQTIASANITLGTKIVNQLTGTTGGAGTYTVDTSQTAASASTTGTIAVGNQYVIPFTVNTSIASDRILVAVVNTRASASRTISAIKIGGANATLVTSQSANTSSSNFAYTHIYQALVPSGTVGDVDVTYSGAINQVSAGLFAVVGGLRSSATHLLLPYDFNSGSNNTQHSDANNANNIPVGTPTNGILIGGQFFASAASSGYPVSAVAHSGNTTQGTTNFSTVIGGTQGAPTLTWTGLTQDSLTVLLDSGGGATTLAAAVFAPHL